MNTKNDARRGMGPAKRGPSLPVSASQSTDWQEQADYAADTVWAKRSGDLLCLLATLSMLDYVDARS